MHTTVEQQLYMCYCCNVFLDCVTDEGGNNVILRKMAFVCGDRTDVELDLTSTNYACLCTMTLHDFVLYTTLYMYFT